MSNSLLKTLHRYNFSKHPIKAVRDRVALPKQNKVYKEYESQDAVKVGDLVIDGVNYGKISENGFNALKNNTLSSYTPVDDEEAATIKNYKDNFKIEIKSSDGKNVYQFSPDDIAGFDSYDKAKKEHRGKMEEAMKPKSAEELSRLSPIERSKAEHYQMHPNLIHDEFAFNSPELSSYLSEKGYTEYKGTVLLYRVQGDGSIVLTI